MCQEAKARILKLQIVMVAWIVRIRKVCHILLLEPEVSYMEELISNIFINKLIQLPKYENQIINNFSFRAKPALPMLLTTISNSLFIMGKSSRWFLVWLLELGQQVKDRELSLLQQLHLTMPGFVWAMKRWVHKTIWVTTKCYRGGIMLLGWWCRLNRLVRETCLWISPQKTLLWIFVLLDKLILLLHQGSILIKANLRIEGSFRCQKTKISRLSAQEYSDSLKRLKPLLKYKRIRLGTRFRLLRLGELNMAFKEPMWRGCTTSLNCNYLRKIRTNIRSHLIGKEK